MLVQSLGDPMKGRGTTRAPWGSKFFHFHTVFGKKKLQNDRTSGVGATSGKSWIATNSDNSSGGSRISRREETKPKDGTSTYYSVKFTMAWNKSYILKSKNPTLSFKLKSTMDYRWIDNLHTKKTRVSSEKAQDSQKTGKNIGVQTAYWNESCLVIIIIECYISAINCGKPWKPMERGNGKFVSMTTITLSNQVTL